MEWYGSMLIIEIFCNVITGSFLMVENMTKKERERINNYITTTLLKEDKEKHDKYVNKWMKEIPNERPR